MSNPIIPIATVARMCHEVNRAWCATNGDNTQLPWDYAPQWQKDSALLGVEGALRGNSPKESHESWMDHKKAEGWTYGSVKDVDAKQHPCMVAYEHLPERQKVKDALFINTVRALRPEAFPD